MWANEKLNNLGEKSESMFKWSPLPERKLFTKDGKYSESHTDLYTNCDASIWLRSSENEIVEPLDGIITGNVPKWLNGSLLRNGPGSIKIGDIEFKHLFDSSALLHRFAIKNGKITYQCRFLKSEVFKKNRAAKRIVVSEFGTCAVPDPCQSIFQRVASIFVNNKVSDNALISVYPIGDEIYAFTESPVIHRVNQITLETEERLDVSKYVTIINHSAHPHVFNVQCLTVLLFPFTGIKLATGTGGGSIEGSTFNLAMSVTKVGLMHNIVNFPSQNETDSNSNLSIFENARIVATVPARWYLHPSYMHTFGITENYFIIVEQPLSLSVPTILLNKVKNEPMIGNFRWYKNEMTQFHVISKKTGQTAFKFYSEAFFFLHIINQYEIKNHLVIDICCYRDPSMLDCMYIETMRKMQRNPDYAKMFRGRPMRFILPFKSENCLPEENLVKIGNTDAKAFLLNDGKIFVKPEQLCGLGCETPRINYDKYLGKEYRYFYAISSDVDSANSGTLIKVDTFNKTCLTWCEANCYPSEPIFVPNPNSMSEDDGIILSSMVWGQEVTNKVGLLILNAVTLTEIGRAEFKTSGPVPKCLHGWFVTQK